MVVNDLDVFWPIWRPAKADPPLIVHADAMLALAVALQCLQPIAGRGAQEFQRRRCLQLCELAGRHLDDRGETRRLTGFTRCKVSRLRRQTGAGFCHEALIRGLTVEGSMGSVVIVVVLPFTKFIVEQVDVFCDAVFVLVRHVLRLRRANPTPTRPRQSRATVAGSGTPGVSLKV